MSTPQPSNITELRKELEGKLHKDGTYHVTPELMEVILANEEKLRILVEALEKIASADYAERSRWAGKQGEGYEANDYYPAKAVRALSSLRPPPLP